MATRCINRVLLITVLMCAACPGLYGIALCDEPQLVVGKVGILAESDERPYPCVYYIPESAFNKEITGIVAIALAGDYDKSPDDSVSNARVRVNLYLHYQNYGPRPRNFSEETGLILLCVAVPRPHPDVYENWGLHPDDLSYARALDWRSLTTGTGDFFRPDLKFIAVADWLMEGLRTHGLVIDPRLLLTGDSAGAGWTHRFAMLHPDRVRAAAPSGTTLWTMPVPSVDGRSLPYPLGIGGLESLDLMVDFETFSRIPFLIHMGIDDVKLENDLLSFLRTGGASTIAGVTRIDAEFYAETYGHLPPERAESFHETLVNLNIDSDIVICNTGHATGWCHIPPRVMRFFEQLELSRAGWD